MYIHTIPIHQRAWNLWNPVKFFFRNSSDIASSLAESRPGGIWSAQRMACPAECESAPWHLALFRRWICGIFWDLTGSPGTYATWLVVWLPWSLFSQKYWVAIIIPIDVPNFSEGWPNHQPDSYSIRSRVPLKPDNSVIQCPVAYFKWGFPQMDPEMVGL